MGRAEFQLALHPAEHGSDDVVIELRDVTVHFPPDPPLLKGVNLTVRRGESLVLIGPGGVGKTVLFKVINGLIPLAEGQVLIQGHDLATLHPREMDHLRKRMGMSFQNYALFDSMTVLENVGFYLIHHTRMSEGEIRRIVRDRLREMRLGDIEHLKPVELSGGMRKRVGLARAIAHEPELLFLDEPTAGLDPISSAVISRLILEMKFRHNITLLTITSDMAVARRIADRIAMIWNRRIHAIGTAAEIFASDEPAVRQFVTGSKDGPIPTIQ